MSETIGSGNPFSSGGHAWSWEPRQIVEKRMIAAGVVGAGRMVTHQGSRRGLICARDGTPAVLRTSGASYALANAAMDALEQALERLRRAGTVSAWEDDAGHTGASLVLLEYRRVGPRRYGTIGGGSYACWQFYTALVEDLDGGDWADDPPVS